MALTKEKSKWDSCLHMDMISSEKSEHEMDEDGRKITKFFVHPIPWRSTKVNNLFESLDKKFLKKQSERSEMMTIKRFRGKPSLRTCPKGKYPAFMIKS